MDFKYCVPVELKNDVNVIKETLSRIGIPNKKENLLYQTCHLIEKDGQYSIIHFKEYFGINVNKFDEEFIRMEDKDFFRRNTIIFLLYKWGLIDVSPEFKQYIEDFKSGDRIFVIPYKEKHQWQIKKKINLA